MCCHSPDPSERAYPNGKAHPNERAHPTPPHTQLGRGGGRGAWGVVEHDRLKKRRPPLFLWGVSRRVVRAPLDAQCGLALRLLPLAVGALVALVALARKHAVQRHLATGGHTTMVAQR